MYFCVQCVSAKEKDAKTDIQKLLNNSIEYDFEVFFPVKEVNEKKNGKYNLVVKPLFPGYLFIWCNLDQENTFPFYLVNKLKGVTRVLNYDNGSHALIGNDEFFARWIHTNDGQIKQSKVKFTEGQPIHIVSGPLVGFDGNVVKVDKHHKRITVRFEIGGIKNDVSFTVEFLEKNQNFTASLG